MAEKLLKVGDDGGLEEVLVNLPSTIVMTASVALSAFDIVYIDKTSENVGQAIADDIDKLAVGFVASAVSSGGDAQVMTEGVLHDATDLGVTGNTTYPVEAGAAVFLSDSVAGGMTTIPVTTSGNYLQKIGVILDTDGAGKALTVDFEAGDGILRK